MTAVIVFLIIVQGVVAGSLAARVAHAKGYEAGGWFLVGLVFGLFGLIGAAGLPDKHARPGEIDEPWMRRCPQCAEAVRPPAMVCIHCGYSFSVQQVRDDAAAHIDSAKEEERRRALQILDQLGDPAVAAAPLKDRLSREPHAWLCEEMIETLDTLGALDVSTLVTVLERTPKMSLTQRLRRQIRTKLLALDPREVVPALRDLLSRFAEERESVQVDLPTDEVIATALWTLRDIGDTEAVPEMALWVRSLGAPSYGHAAWEGIRSMGTEALPALRTAREAAPRRRRRLLDKLIAEIESTEGGTN